MLVLSPENRIHTIKQLSDGDNFLPLPTSARFEMVKERGSVSCYQLPKPIQSHVHLFLMVPCLFVVKWMSFVCINLMHIVLKLLSPGSVNFTKLVPGSWVGKERSAE